MLCGAAGQVARRTPLDVGVVMPDATHDAGGSGRFIVSGGGYVAIAVGSHEGSATTNELIVVRLSDAKTWNLGQGPGKLHWTWPSSMRSDEFSAATEES